MSLHLSSSKPGQFIDRVRQLWSSDHFVELVSSYYVPYDSLTDAEKTMKMTLLFFFYGEISCRDIVGAKSDVESRNSLVFDPSSFCLVWNYVFTGSIKKWLNLRKSYLSWFRFYNDNLVLLMITCEDDATFNDDLWRINLILNHKVMQKMLSDQRGTRIFVKISSA